MANPTGKTFKEIFGDTPLTDQYGQPFDPASLGNGPCLVLFGYGGCPMCTDITDSVAAVQQDFIRRGKELPIVVVSAQPDVDRHKMLNYISGYYNKGVRQFAHEPLEPEDPAALFHAGKHKTGRILHVCCAPEDKENQDKKKMNRHAREIQTRLGLATNENLRPDPNNPDKMAVQHSATLTLFDKGRVVKQYPGLPGTEYKDEELAAHAKKLAGEVSADVEKFKNMPASAPKVENTMLWNIGVPAAVGIGTLLLSGQGISLGGIVASLLAAGAASLGTQYFTKTGLFEEKISAPPAPVAAAPPERKTGTGIPGRDIVRKPDVVAAQREADKDRPSRERALAMPDSKQAPPLPAPPTRTVQL